MRNKLKDKKLKEIIEKYPFVLSFFEENSLDIKGKEEYSFEEYLNEFSEDEIENMALDLNKLLIDFYEYIKQMKEFLGIQEDEGVKSLSIIAGRDKNGVKEKFERLDINKSEMIAIVGATGSGKSRLLADIEWVAQNDTPTERSILINGEKAKDKWRFSSNNKLVAQLSQNMNFVMDLSVKDFLEMHAKSRMVEDIDKTIEKIIEEANKLAGEQFNIDTQITALSGGQSRALMIADTAILSSSPIVLIDEIENAGIDRKKALELDTQITALSGGQSRALMIADTAILSSSPIVLIDEIENAGIDRKKALELLISSDKIVLMATHDPTLALIADKRIVIKNGGISDIIETSKEEKAKLKELEEMDNIIQEMRRALRAGEKIG